MMMQDDEETMRGSLFVAPLPSSLPVFLLTVLPVFASPCLSLSTRSRRQFAVCLFLVLFLDYCTFAVSHPMAPQHVTTILLAEFDIDQGSTLTHQYPSNITSDNQYVSFLYKLKFLADVARPSAN